jgi:hypothetical protein
MPSGPVDGESKTGTPSILPPSLSIQHDTGSIRFSENGSIVTDAPSDAASRASQSAPA